MSEEPSRNIRLFGTEQLVPPPQVLRAGELTAEFEAGNLRYIRFGGIEMIRAISFIVRDKNWGTYDSVISDLKISREGEAFRVAYQATAKDASQEFRYAAEIVGSPNGSLRFQVRGQAVTNFITNRTGFVVLRPIANWRAGKRSLSASTAIRSKLAFPKSSIPYNR
jgi:D-apionolactonase